MKMEKEKAMRLILDRAEKSGGAKASVFEILKDSRLDIDKSDVGKSFKALSDRSLSYDGKIEKIKALFDNKEIGVETFLGMVQALAQKKAEAVLLRERLGKEESELGELNQKLNAIRKKRAELQMSLENLVGAADLDDLLKEMETLPEEQIKEEFARRINALKSKSKKTKKQGALKTEKEKTEKEKREIERAAVGISERGGGKETKEKERSPEEKQPPTTKIPEIPECDSLERAILLLQGYLLKDNKNIAVEFEVSERDAVRLKKSAFNKVRSFIETWHEALSEKEVEKLRKTISQIKTPTIKKLLLDGFLSD
jgi:hypothetical protein